MITKQDQRDAMVYLDNLRESGECNMFEAPARMREIYGFSRPESYEVFKSWTEKFEK